MDLTLRVIPAKCRHERAKILYPCDQYKHTFLGESLLLSSDNLVGTKALKTALSYFCAQLCVVGRCMFQESYSSSHYLTSTMFRNF